MINTDKAKWDLSKEEKYAIKWFNENGFDGELVKQYISKTKFTVSKNGVTDNFELPQGYENMNIAKYMDQYMHSFLMKCEIEKMKSELKSRCI